MGIEKTKIIPEDAENVIGTLHSWSVKETLLEKDVVKAKFIDSGLPEELFKFKTSPSNLLNKAIKRIKTTGTGIDFEDVKNKRNTDDYIKTIYSKVQEEGQEKLKIEHHGLLVLNPKSGVLTIESSHPIAREINDQYSKAENLIDDHDIRGLIKKSIKWSKGICVRTTGGIYFIPRTLSDRAQSISDFLGYDENGNDASGIAQSVKFYIFPVVGTEKNKGDISEDFEKMIADKIEKLEVEIGEENMTNKIIANRLATLNDLKKQVDFYAVSVDVKKNSVLGKLEKMERKLGEIISS